MPQPVDLEITLAAMETRLAHIRHDLLSPLNAILGFAQVMKLDPAPKSVLQQDAIAQILKCGWQLLNMINTISINPAPTVGDPPVT